LRRYIAIRCVREENPKVMREGPLRGGTTTCKPRWENELRLRPARLGDYAFALSLYLEGAELHLSKIGQWNRARIVSKFRQGYKLAPAQVICVGEKRIGWIQVADFVDHMHLRQIHLVREARGKGIGTRLMRELLQRADALGKFVTLDVMHGNPARFLYLRLGFRQRSQNAATRQMIWRPPRG
jgi:ribosomal protein S18 acetylase RimI-like enzyme